MSYDKINHALISRINPKINPTLKQGYSSVCTSAKNIVLPATAIGAVVDVANSVFTGCTPFAYSTAPATSYTITIQAGEINKLVLDDGTILIPTPNGFKDVSGNDNHSTSTTMTMTHLSDSSVFYLEEYGFATDAVNNCYPILVNRSGYAGLDPVSVVKTYPRGLISRKGSIDIEAWNLLDTLIDFGNSTAVKATGLRISEMDGVDCNSELIYVAEPKLDPAEIAILVPSAGDEFKLDTNFTVSGTSNCANVKIEASANGVDWTTLSASTTVTAGAFSKADCQLASATFAPNDVITLKVSDVDSVSTPDTVIVGTIATVTLTAIDSITATVAKTISGFTNGASVNVYYKLHSAGSWTLAGAGTVDTGAGTWTYDITIPTADTYDVKVTDGTDSDAYDQQDSIVVASAETILENWESYTVGTIPNPPITAYNCITAFTGGIQNYGVGGGKCWKAIYQQRTDKYVEITFSSTVDFTGKKLRVFMKNYSNQNLYYFRMELYAGGTLKWNKNFTTSDLSYNTWNDIQETIADGSGVTKLKIFAGQNNEDISYYILIDTISML